MKRLIWTLVAIAISTGVYFTIRYGLRPKPIPVLNPTEFADLEQVGAVIYKNLRQNVRAERLILLGSRGELPGESRVWLGFLKAAAADGEKIVLFSRGPKAEVKTGAWEEVVSTAGDAELTAQVLTRMRGGQLVVVEAKTTEATHLVTGSLGRAFEDLVKHPVLSISILPLALNEAERDGFKPRCLDTGEDPDGQRRLWCAALRVSRKFARKNLVADRIWAVSERHGLKEYLVFVHEP